MMMSKKNSLENRKAEMRRIRKEAMQLYGLTEKQKSKYKGIQAYKQPLRLCATMGKVKGYILFKDSDLEGWRKNFFNSETWEEFKQLRDFSRDKRETMYQYFCTDVTQQLELIVLELLEELTYKVYIEGWEKTREVVKIKDKGTIHARQETAKEKYKVYNISKLEDREIYKYFFKAKSRFYDWLTRKFADTINYHISIDAQIEAANWTGENKDLRILDRLEDWKARLKFDSIDTVQALEALVPHLTEAEYNYLRAKLQGKKTYRSGAMNKRLQQKFRRYEVVISNKLYQAGV